MNFKIKESCKIKGVYIIEPDVNQDIRGSIWTSFLNEEYKKILPEDCSFVHDKFSSSKNNVLRGIHGDHQSWKLVTCVYGEICQCVVDLRDNSKTKNEYILLDINYNLPKLVLIPPSMGNAFYVKSGIAIYHYKLAYKGSYIDANEQFSYKWNDPNFKIKWPTNSPILSERDK